jgi:hypothetical protein
MTRRAGIAVGGGSVRPGRTRSRLAPLDVGRLRRRRDAPEARDAPAVAPGSFRDFFGWREMGLVAGIFAAGISHAAVATGVLLGLLVWAATGPVAAFKALTMVALIKFANPVLASVAPGAGALNWLITIVACLRLLQSARQASRPFLLVLAFCLVAAVTSLIASASPDISAMKVTVFFLVASAVVLAATGLTREDVRALQRWFFSAALVMAGLSLLTVPMPGVNYYQAGFQGIFRHPQSTGVFFVPFVSWLIARLFLEKLSDLPKWVPAVAVLFAGLIVASGARTAMLAAFLGVGATLLWVLLQPARFPAAGPRRERGEIIGFTTGMLILAVVVVLFGGLKDELESVALKGESVESLGEEFQSSRGAMIKAHVQNFLDAPLTGHGFGVFREGARNVERFLGIPISASAEKGVAFTSVLEETGLFGALLFYALLATIFVAVARGGDPPVLAMAFGAVLVNFGEAVIFAPGGMGLFMWVLVGFALARARAGEAAGDRQAAVRG